MTFASALDDDFSITVMVPVPVVMRPSVMITIPGSGRIDRKAGQASARIRYAAGRASRSLSSWMSTAIFVRADECCRL